MTIYGIPTIRRFDTLAIQLDALLSGTEVPYRIIVVDNSGGEAVKYCANTNVLKKYSASFLDKIIEFDVQERNLGVAGSWNRIMELSQSDTIIANDDILPRNDMVENLEKYYVTTNAPFIYGECPEGNGTSFAMFRLSRAMYRMVGMFDTNIYPAYFEDNDYHYRMKLSGYDTTYCSTAIYSHVGSGTLRTYNEQEQQRHHFNFQKNQAYYSVKWGNLPGKEVFRNPFNNPNL